MGVTKPAEKPAARLPPSDKDYVHEIVPLANDRETITGFDIALEFKAKRDVLDAAIARDCRVYLNAGLSVAEAFEVITLRHGTDFTRQKIEAAVTVASKLLEGQVKKQIMVSGESPQGRSNAGMCKGDDAPRLFSAHHPLEMFAQPWQRSSQLAG
jgi:hypothetical protein